jgi:hypothetical protein
MDADPRDQRIREHEPENARPATEDYPIPDPRGTLVPGLRRRGIQGL